MSPATPPCPPATARTPNAAGSDACAIDFGTSNSAVAILTASGPTLVPLEQHEPTLPTAVFYVAEGPNLDQHPCRFGRAALGAYVEGLDGRLMRSMKSALGSPLMTQHTDIGAGRSVSLAEVIATYLRHLKAQAEQHTQQPLRRVVMGRPVHFVDDDAERDAQAQADLAAAAHSVGFEEVAFQYEPIAAAFAFEQSVDREQRVLVADIGGGTSDFSVVRVGPQQRLHADRRDDVLANHGIHIAGTDFDRRIALATIMRELGFGAFGPSIAGRPPREVPSGVYYDLSTWHLINTVYRPQRIHELRAMRDNYARPEHHARLMTVVTEHLGHEMLARAERAKIDVAGGSGLSAAAATATIDLQWVERGLHCTLTPSAADDALRDDIRRITAAATDTVRQAGLLPSQIDALFFTGGSTGLQRLTDALGAAFTDAQRIHGDRLASVVTGLGLDAHRRFIY